MLFFCCFLFVIFCLYFSLNRYFSYWKLRGFPQLHALSSSLQLFLMRTGPSHHCHNIYRESRHLPYVGIFILHTPKLIVNDLNIIKKILIQDFEDFPSRNEIPDEELDPILSRTTFMISGDKWRYARSLMSPCFTTARIKMMFDKVNTCGKHLGEYLLQLHDCGKCPKSDDLSTSGENKLCVCVCVCVCTNADSF